MSSKILMPSGGQTTDEMLIMKWYKQVGETVNRGDILFEIETDKAILTVESYAAGTLLEIRYPDGKMVKTGEVVAIIGDASEQPTPVAEKSPAAVPNTGKPPHQQQIQNEITQPAGTHALKNASGILASPLAKNLARIEQIKIEDVAGYVCKNLIKKADVDQYLENIRSSKKLSLADEQVYYIDTDSVRKTIARRMRESVSTAPHYIVSADIDFSAVIRLRKKLNLHDEGSGNVSYNAIIMKVVSKAIESYPLINSSFEETRIRVSKDVNFGLAIATETGIIVPVVKEVNKKSIPEISSGNAVNSEKVKTNKLLPTDISGGTITLSNLGMFGIDNFTAIINQPESCILAVGAIIKKVVVVDNEMAIRDMMNITGSFDHRVIDGAYAAAFLKKTRSMLEDPELLLLF
ncbi:MAG: dihydrolipoamide acetyltransferase family protein [Ferruginibacter sp.]